MSPKPGQIWAHHKTKGEYEIIGIGKLQIKDGKLDMTECVIYRALLDDTLWVRPLQDFTEMVDGEKGRCPRFSFLR